MDYRDTVHDRLGFNISIELLYGREVHFGGLFLSKLPIERKLEKSPFLPTFSHEVKIIITNFV